MNKIDKIKKILALFLQQGYHLSQYSEGKPTVFFLDPKRGVMIAQIYHIEENHIHISQSRDAQESDVDEDSLKAYYADAMDILFNQHIIQLKTALLNQFLSDQ